MTPEGSEGGVMTKRSAILLSGGLVTALLAAMIALLSGRGLVKSADAATVAKPAPIVKTETRVVTVQKKAPAGKTTKVTIIRYVYVPVAGTSSQCEEKDDHKKHEEHKEDHHQELHEDDAPRSG
jgi:uncharacterized membrane protein (UPF0136 family)